MISKSASFFSLMDKELKISLILLLVLCLLPPALLYSLAGISPFSKSFLSGFLPYLSLLVPYILLSSSQVTAFLQEKIKNSLPLKLILPFHLIFLYTILQFLYSSFQLNFFLIFLLWLGLPTLLFCFSPNSTLRLTHEKGESKWGWRDFVVVLLLWLPIEYGYVRGFEFRFSMQTQISALPLAAPLFGLYLFLILRNLSDIGFTFFWRWKDLAKAGLALLALAMILIPLGIATGFIQLDLRQVSVPEILQLIFGIYFFVALPEELLFRGIIQNLLSKTITPTFILSLSKEDSKGGGQWIALLASSLIFGLAHYNNYSPTDWRYVYLSVIAGIFYGATYMKTGKTTVSAIVHCSVNFIWAMFFKGTRG